MRHAVLVAMTAALGMGYGPARQNIDFPPSDPSANFAGSWSCLDDAGDSLSFVVTVEGSNELTASVSMPLTGVTCTETFAVSGTIAILIPSLTSCNVPQGDLEVTLSQDASINVLTYTSENEGGPSQTLTCTVDG